LTEIEVSTASRTDYALFARPLRADLPLALDLAVFVAVAGLVLRGADFVPAPPLLDPGLFLAFSSALDTSPRKASPATAPTADPSAAPALAGAPSRTSSRAALRALLVATAVTTAAARASRTNGLFKSLAAPFMTVLTRLFPRDRLAVEAALDLPDERDFVVGMFTSARAPARRDE
jgi:hypothetical protein